jgi:IS30 family transposase
LAILQKAKSSLETRGQVIGRLLIDERPSFVDEKERIGDREAETVIVKGNKRVLLTQARPR